MTEDKKAKLFYGYIVVVVACLILVVTQGLWFSYGVFFKPISEDFGWTRAVTAGAFSLSTLLHAFVSLVAGKLNDRFGPRKLIVVCGLFLGLGYLLMSQISTIWQLYLFFGVVIAIGQGCAFVPLVSTVSRWFVKRRGLMSGIVVAGAGLGTLNMPPVANLLIASFDWSNTYVIVGIATLLFIVMAAQFLRRDPSQVGQLPYGETEVSIDNSNANNIGLSLNQTMRTIQFWLLVLFFLFIMFVSFVILVHLVPHATDLGISKTTSANMLALVGMGSIVGKISMGYISDKVGCKKSLMICAGFIAFSLGGFLIAREIWTISLFALIFGYGFGGIVSAEPLIIGELFGLKSHGAIFGALAVVIGTGGAIGPIVAGKLFDATGSYQLAFILSTILASASLLPLFFLKVPNRKHLR